jgi:hypothetical protein
MNDDIERILADTGHRWRDRTGPKERPDPGLFAGDRGPHRRHARLLALAAAAAVVAIVAGVIGVNHAWNRSSPASVPPSTIVRNGDTVAASGRVVVSPDGSAKFCSQIPWTTYYYMSPHAVTTNQDPGPDPGCLPPIALRNVDPGKLAKTSSANGVVTGNAHIEGVWQDNTIIVTHQEPEPKSTIEGPQAPSTPCPAPVGGWSPNNDPDQRKALQNYLAAHPDAYSGDWVSVSNAPTSSGTSPSDDTTQVVVVGAVGDLTAARKILTAIYPGNLCVIKAASSASRLEKAREFLRRELQFGAPSISLAPAGQNRLCVYLIVPVIDRSTWRLIEQAGGSNVVSVNPLIQKIGSR